MPLRNERHHRGHDRIGERDGHLRVDVVFSDPAVQHLPRRVENGRGNVGKRVRLGVVTNVFHRASVTSWAYLAVRAACKAVNCFRFDSGRGLDAIHCGPGAYDVRVSAVTTDQYPPDRSGFLVFATGPDELFIRHQPCQTTSRRYIIVEAPQLDGWVAAHVCPKR